MNALPGGGEFGRGARREVRNPILLLPASRGILELPIERRRPLGILLRQLADQASGQAQISWKQNKGIMAAYWKAVSVYAKHLARVIDPISARSGAVSPQERSNFAELERRIVDYFETAGGDVEQDGAEWFLSLYDEGPAISLTALAAAILHEER